MTQILSDTTKVIGALVDAGRHLRDKQREQAIATLRTMDDTVKSLEKAFDGYRAQAENKQALARQAQSQMEIERGKAYAREHSIATKIDGLNALLAHEQSLSATTEAHRQEIAGKIERLRAEAKAHQDHLDELKSYCWVPGYGTYLAIRTLADNDIGDLNSTIAESNRLQNELANNNSSIRQVRQIIAQAEQMLSVAKQRDVEVQQNLLQITADIGRASRCVTFLSDAKTFWALVIGKLKEIDSRIDETNEIIVLLDKQIPWPLRVEGSEETSRLQDALVNFARYVESGGHI